jgi:hypothetical protein
MKVDTRKLTAPLASLSERLAALEAKVLDTNHDAPPGARVSDRQCASPADTGADTELSRAGQSTPPEPSREPKCTERESVTERRPPEPGGRGNVTGFTEPVACSVVEEMISPPWAEEMISPIEVTYGQAAIDRLAADRDAAIRERDQAREECERLREKVRVMDGQSRMDIEKEIAVEEAWESCDIRPYWPDDEPGTSHRYAQSMMLEIVKLRARVAELESAAKLAPAASGAGNSPESPVSSEVVAWGILRGGHLIAATVNKVAANESCKDHGGTIVPLYAAPQPATGWLTAEERDAIQWAISEGFDEEVLRILLARSSPPEVVLPGEPNRFDYGDAAIANRDRQWLAAIASAGVKVKEVEK